jgi:hypothetical protein
VLFNGSYLGDSIGPHLRASCKAHYLGRDCNFNFDAAVVIKFLKLFEASAENVIDIGVSVTFYLGKVLLARRCPPPRWSRTHASNASGVIIKPDLFRRRSGKQWPLPQ